MTRAQVTRVLEMYGAAIAKWCEFTTSGCHQHADKMLRASQCVVAGRAALEDGKLATAIQMLGVVQGIMFAIGFRSWEQIAMDNRQ